MDGSEIVLFSQAAEGFAKAIATVLSAVFCYWFFIYGIPQLMRMLGIVGDYITLHQVQNKADDLECRLRKIEDKNKDKTKKDKKTKEE